MALVEYENIRIDLRKATNADAFRRELIVDRLKAVYGEKQIGYIVLFARIATQGKDALNLPFSVSSDPQDDEICRAFDAFMGMDEDFTNVCWDAMKSLHIPADPAMAPEGLGDNPDPNSLSAAKPSRKSGATTSAE